MENFQSKTSMILKAFVIMLMLFALALPLHACKKKPEIPEQIEEPQNSEPTLNVYDISKKQTKEMDLEEYIEGVVAGEMFPNWPLEALKAQAILARTYSLYFIANHGGSKYRGADISTDITEAQAYSKESVNENIKQAVRETRGQIIAKDGEYVHTWFHSNAGGKTAKAKEGLNLWGDEPEFIKMATSPETNENSQNATWKETFKKSEILAALRKMKVSVSNVSSFEVAERGESGRAITFKIGGRIVSAPEFRLAIGSTRMKSTKISDIKVSKNSVTFSGMGYGHGVGLSQWGAKIMAEEGKSAQEIVKHYFNDVDIVKLY